VSLEVEEGEFLGFVGPSGGGKTTLIKIILGQLQAQHGQIEVFGRPPTEARKEIGYVPQFNPFSRDFPISVEDVVLTGRLGKTPLVGRYRSRDRKRVGEVLESLKISDLRSRTIGTLSGGQMQRVLVARALVSDPKILFLDEPTTSLDPQSEKITFDLLAEINAATTIILVSHDIGFISHYIQRVACINQTLVCHPASALTQDNIEKLYGSHLNVISHTHVEGDHH